MKKPIAILSSNIVKTARYLRDELGVKTVNMAKRIAIDDTGQEYVIITAYEDAISWEFSAVIKAPDYESLEERVRRRIR